MHRNYGCRSHWRRKNVVAIMMLGAMRDMFQEPRYKSWLWFCAAGTTGDIKVTRELRNVVEVRESPLNSLRPLTQDDVEHNLD